MGALTARKISLTKNRREILEYLACNQFITRQKLVDRFWPDESSARQATAVWRLKKSGLVKTLKGDGRSALGLTLTEKGIRVLRSMSYVDGAVSMKNSYRSSFDHDVLLRDIVAIFRSSGVVRNFIPEWEFKKSLRNGQSLRKLYSGDPIPDAIFEVMTNFGPVSAALELELTQKNRRRYRKTLRSRLLSKEYESIFYIVDGETIQRTVEGVVTELREKDSYVRLSNRVNSLYLASLDEFLKAQLGTTFYWKNEAVNFKIMEQNFNASSPSIKR